MPRERTRTPQRREDIARFAFRAIELRRGNIPRFGTLPCSPREIIDGLVREDPSLIAQSSPNEKSRLAKLREEVKREITG